MKAIKHGWLFQGYSTQTQYLYHVPSDTREQMIECLLEPYHNLAMVRPPTCYRDEENQITLDLKHFLIQKQEVRTTDGGAIYPNQLRQLMDIFYVSEELITGKGPRFGFGRTYHLYPDRFSLIYDFALYHSYFFEDTDGYLRLVEQNFGNVLVTDEKELVFNLYRFWIRLYKRPIPNLPIVLKWIGFFAHMGWFPVVNLFKSLFTLGLSHFITKRRSTLFNSSAKNVIHLGVLRIGEEESGATVFDPHVNR